MHRTISTVMTHCAAALLGWAGWTVFLHSKEDAHSPQDARMVTKAPPTQKSADEILEIIASQPQKAKEESPGGLPVIDDAARAAFMEEIQSLAVPDDLKAALEEELERNKNGGAPSARTGALMYFFALRDFPGLLRWAGWGEENRQGRAFYYFLNDLVAKLIAEKGLGFMPPIPDGAPWQNALNHSIACTLAKSADSSGLAAFKRGVSSKRWEQLLPEIADRWPWAGRDTLAAFAVSENQPEMIAKLAVVQEESAAEAGRWITGLLSDEALSPAFREILAKCKLVKNLAHAARKMPLAERISLLQADGSRGENDYDALAWRDVSHIFRNERSWDYEFRHGAVDAPEVLTALSREMPELAAVAPETLHKWTFRYLIEEDPVRAMRLLDGMPPDERTKMVLETAGRQFYQTDPNRFLTAIQQIPADDPRFHDDRLNVWIKKTGYNYQDHDAAYVEWVRALPAGVDRQMALCALAQVAAKDQPALAAELRGEITDAELQRKAAK